MNKGPRAFEIRRCAAEILTELRNPEHERDDIPSPKGYSKTIIAHAYELLRLEGLVSRRVKYRLSDYGEQHVLSHGAVVYPTPDRR